MSLYHWIPYYSLNTIFWKYQNTPYQNNILGLKNRLFIFFKVPFDRPKQGLSKKKLKFGSIAIYNRGNIHTKTQFFEKPQNTPY